MRAIDKFFMQEQVLRILAERPMQIRDILARVSGTRGDVVDTLNHLRSEGRLETDDEVPRNWKLRGISYESGTDTQSTSACR